MFTSKYREVQEMLFEQSDFSIFKLKQVKNGEFFCATQHINFHFIYISVINNYILFSSASHLGDMHCIKAGLITIDKGINYLKE